MKFVYALIIATVLSIMSFQAFAGVELTEMSVHAVKVMAAGDYSVLEVKLDGAYYTFTSQSGNEISAQQISQMEQLFTAAMLSGKRVKINIPAAGATTFYAVKLVNW